MRILYVGMAESVHFARFLSQVNELPWDLHLFNSNPNCGAYHPFLRNVTLHGSWSCSRPKDVHASVRCEGFWPFKRGAFLANHLVNRFSTVPCGERSARRLARVIDKLQPDIIHSHEMQHGGYLVLDALKWVKGKLPPWIVTNWGHDIYFFGRLKEHQAKIREVLSACNYYTCETERDRHLAAPFGFKGEILLPVMPNPGGFRFAEIEQLRTPGPTSARKVILLKGYQDLIGRSLTALYAFELCQELLHDYKIIIYSPAPDVAPAAEMLAQSCGLNIECLHQTLTHDDMLRLRGQARISIGLSVSDAASISFLEALVMGSFPIQSDRGGTQEWIRDGEGGFIVRPDDPHAVAAALRRAVTDDALVDRAAVLNQRTARERMDFFKLRRHVINWYESILATPRIDMPLPAVRQQAVYPVPAPTERIPSDMADDGEPQGVATASVG